jgi:hypothetical protein
MYADGANATIENRGTIHLSGAKSNDNEDSNQNKAMFAEHGGTIKNNGHIVFDGN